MKQVAGEFITEQENEDKLNHEIDALLDGVDFSEPLSAIDQNDCTPTQDEVSITLYLNVSILFSKWYLWGLFHLSQATFKVEKNHTSFENENQLYFQFNP